MEEDLMDLQDTSQLKEAKSRLTTSVKGLEESVNACLQRFQQRYEAAVEQQDNVSGADEVIETLRRDISEYASQNAQLQVALLQQEEAYKKLKLTSEQSVEVLDAAIETLEACSSGE